MKRLFIVFLLILNLLAVTAGCATVNKEAQSIDQIKQLQQQLEEQKYKNDELAVKMFRLEQKFKQQQSSSTEKTEKVVTQPQTQPQIPSATPAPPEKSEKKEIPQPIAPVRPVLKAYLNQQVASGPHVVAIKNATKYIWISFEINGRPVIIVRNGFLNEYPTDKGPVTLLPPGEVAYLILENIGSTSIKARAYTGVTPPLLFQKERAKSYNFHARAEPYQRSIWDRWDF